MFILLSCGENDVDQYQSDCYVPIRNMDGRSKHWKNVKRELNMKFNEIKKDINEVLNFIYDAFPDDIICYLKIKPRHWWSVRSRVLARWMDYHVCVRLRKRFRVQEIWNRGIFAEQYQFGEQVIYGMLHTDIVHFNTHGNTCLASVILKCILNKWKGKLGLFGLKRDQI